MFKSYFFNLSNLVKYICKMKNNFLHQSPSSNPTINVFFNNFILVKYIFFRQSPGSDPNSYMFSTFGSCEVDFLKNNF